MKRLLPVIVFACALPVLPQETPKAEATAAAPASSVPSDEAAVTGFVDLGYRWVGTGGSFNTYRSVVNLGSGPKLLGTEFEILDRKRRLFDRVEVRGYNWGDDPYSTFHLTARKNNLYDFSADYRNIAYYNNLPAFADPLLPTGVVLNEQALDTHRRIGSYQLTFHPESWLIPYVAYDRVSGKGTGIANFVSNGNEFPVGSLIGNSTDHYRGGLRIEQPRFHITLEQGGTKFRDDQKLGMSTGTNYGNFTRPLLGETLVLTSLSQTYRVRGDSMYSKALLTASLASWVDLYGQFLFSQPESNVNFQQFGTGNQVLFSQLLFYTGEQSIVSAVSKLPHTSASLGTEMRPLRRMRVIPVWLTDRLHTNSSESGQQKLAAATGGTVTINSLLSNALVNNYSQAEVNVLFDVLPRLTLRGGYRYVWGNASNVILPLGGLAGLEQGRIRRNVMLAGVAFRPSPKASLNADYEDGSSGRSYFRTSLFNYQKGRMRGRYQISQALSIAGSATILSNQNPNPGISYDYFSHQETASFVYSPSAGRRWDIQGGYTRATIRSDINYLVPAFLNAQRSFYRDNSHVATGLFNANIPVHRRTIRISAGGSLFLSSGSNPTQFYQPVGKLSVPVNKTLAWVTEWRYYGFDENFYGYQAFRAQTVTTGVRLTR